MPAAPATLVLVHSPFLGPSAMRPLADRLAGGCATPDLREAVEQVPFHTRLATTFRNALDSVDRRTPIVLVGHSGAGPLLPMLADATDHDVAALIYLDAGLPTPGRSWRDTAPPHLHDHLRALATDGLLPPWHRWFDADPLPELVTDQALRAAIADEEPTVPLAFLSEPRPATDWHGAAGYLQLSVPYSDVAEQTRALGWPTRTLDGLHHLAPATHPDTVAGALRELLDEVTG